MNANRILFVVLILLIILIWILPPFTTKIKHGNGGIGEKVFLEIGGAQQGMIIKGNDMEKPVCSFCREDRESRNTFWIINILLS